LPRWGSRVRIPSSAPEKLQVTGRRTRALSTAERWLMLSGPEWVRSVRGFVTEDGARRTRKAAKSSLRVVSDAIERLSSQRITAPRLARHDLDQTIDS
jgi:hypothetical protein